jgi:hypothetical protein
MSDTDKLRAEVEGLRSELDGIIVVFISVGGCEAVRHLLSVIEKEAVDAATLHDGLARVSGIVKAARECAFGKGQ